MRECYRAMMRISLFNQYVAVKTSHFRYGKYADAAKAPCPNRQDLSLRDVGFHLSASRTLPVSYTHLDVYKRQHHEKSHYALQCKAASVPFQYPVSG